MNSLRSSRLEKVLLGLLLAVFVVPLPLTAFMHFSVNHTGFVGALRRIILSAGVGDVSPLPRPTFDEVRSARYQEGLAARFNDGYGGRDWVIYCTQEAYQRLFHNVQGPAILGRGNSTFYNQRPYQFVDEYCVDRQPPDMVKSYLDGLRLWRDSCLARGVGFAILITPSKASIYPEDLPEAWQRRRDPRPRVYDDFVRLLQQEGIHYIDGHVLTMAAKAGATAPVFPLGGTHWGQYASLQTANAVLRDLAAQGQPVRPIENVQTAVSNEPINEDSDMLDVIQPLFRWKYPVSKVAYPPVPSEEGSRPSLVLIGGSFLSGLGLHLYNSGQFSEIHWLRYYQMAREIPAPDQPFGWQIDNRPTPVPDLRREIFAAQCVVLEVNEQQLTNPLHLHQLFDDTVQTLPGGGAPGCVFPYQAFQPCRWGEPIRFTYRDASPVRPGIFSGLSGPEIHGSWTDGPDTTLRLTVPDVAQDAILSVEAGAAIVPDKLPVQRVGIFANGRPVGEWAYDAGGLRRYEVVIPRALLGDGRLTLHFHYSQTISPAQISDSTDTRQLALLFQTLTLRQPGRRVDGPVYSAAVTEKADPVYAAGFSGAEDSGRWTDGTSATLRLPVPPVSEQDAVLSAEFDPAIIAGKLLEQRARIVVNGQPVGEWIIGAPGVQRREVVIPRTLLKADKLEVGFQFSDTFMPAKPGSGGDTRRLALFFKNVQLHWFAPVEGAGR